jgi:hypothetical protein
MKISATTSAMSSTVAKIDKRLEIAKKISPIKFK